jgi:hypothetical protein
MNRIYTMLMFLGGILALTLAALTIAAILTGCATHQPPAPEPTTPLISPPAVSPLPQPSNTTRISATHTSRPPTRVTPYSSVPHRAVHAGEYCKGTDKNTYAYDNHNGDLLWCGPTDAELPYWHKVN